MEFSLTALSPVDGRYRAATEGLAALLSESGLVRERIRVEALWALQLGEVLHGQPVAELPALLKACLAVWKTVRA